MAFQTETISRAIENWFCWGTTKWNRSLGICLSARKLFPLLWLSSLGKAISICQKIPLARYCRLLVTLDSVKEHTKARPTGGCRRWGGEIAFLCYTTSRVITFQLQNITFDKNAKCILSRPAKSCCLREKVPQGLNWFISRKLKWLEFFSLFFFKCKLEKFPASLCTFLVFLFLMSLSVCSAEARATQDLCWCFWISFLCRI